MTALYNVYIPVSPIWLFIRVLHELMASVKTSYTLHRLNTLHSLACPEALVALSTIRLRA